MCTGKSVTGENMSIMVGMGLEVLADDTDDVDPVSGESFSDLNNSLKDLVNTFGLAAVLGSLNEAALSAAEVHEGSPSFAGDATATNVVCARLRVFASRTRDALDATK